MYKEHGILRATYLSAIEEAYQQCAGYFTDASKNLETLNSIAAKIKKRAIEPSFSLLDQTQRQLESVKKEIERVQFA